MLILLFSWHGCMLRACAAVTNAVYFLQSYMLGEKDPVHGKDLVNDLLTAANVFKH